eukprot:TRINITY_DN16472_c0_g2_i1.p1 TRINITY_DN16472_c0_g2~~TRINITY_DN16472_c0_g2_i1.p1  ORF type:complete len:276 (-),score=36.18 TRINITY_DN16472_c0_g2_i1:123-950(-)
MRSMALLVLFMAVGVPMTVHAVRQTATNGNVVGTVAGLDEYDSNASTIKTCRDFCVQCADGATVYYGRNRNWWKAVAMPVGLAAGAAIGAVSAPFSVGATTLIYWGVETVALYGAVTGATAGAVGGAVAVVDSEKDRNSTNQTAEDRGMTVTHWYGHIPSSGILCERLDVVKFHKDADGNTLQTTLVNKENGNLLKPYDKHAELKSHFEPEDIQFYRNGCKVVKGSGLKGWKQVSRKAVDTAVEMCSLHSKLCGAHGEATIVPVESPVHCGLLSK